MKLNWLTIGTHLAVAMLTGIGVWGASVLQLSPLSLLAIGGVLACLTGWWLGRRVGRSLQALEAIIRPDAPPVERSGISDIDQLTKQVQSRVLRWAETTASAQQGLREAEELVALLDRRPHDRSATGGRHTIAHLRRLIASLLESANHDLVQLTQDSGELESKLSLVSTCASDQSEAVSRTTTYVEQLSLQFDDVAEATNTAQNAVQQTRESTQTVHNLLDAHARRIDQLQSRMEGTERRLRALKERSQSIQTIIATIGDVSSRTDLLALNASIESYRAGEQGRGFSVVAEEVRKLAETSAQSTRDISVLIEAIQTDADESARAIADQRRETTEEVTHMRSTGERLADVGTSCDSSIARMRDITRLAGQQLHLTQGLVSAVERISETNRQSRGKLEEANWMAHSISKATSNLEGTLSALHLERRRGSHKPEPTSSLRSNSRTSEAFGSAPFSTDTQNDNSQMSDSMVQFVLEGREA